MGKKKGGSGTKDKAKEEKKKKQEQKAQKKATKKAKKGQDGSDSEDDLEALLAEFRAKDADRTSVNVENNVPPPTPRSNFSISPLEGSNSNELLVFGGELYDGNSSECYNDLYRLNLEKLEWRKISSPNTPDPRNAHQAVTVRDHVYIFGGEFSHGFSFHHYRDLWKLDLTKNVWTNIETKTGPSPRSGHRMVLWKHFLVLFGGFYETSRGVKFYDDLYFFDLRDEKWIQGIPSKTAQKPTARSGFQFVTYGSKNTIFMYGGYSKVSVSSSSEKGRNLDDMWALHLTLPSKAGECPGFKWDPIPKKGSPPSKRSGATCCVHKSRLILFGGVTDKELSTDVEGEFFNQLYSFDMERHKWFALNVAKKKAQVSGRRRNKDKSGASQVSSLEHGNEEDDIEEDNEKDNDNDDDNDEYFEDDFGLDDNAFYVIIDGKLTKIEYDDDDEEEEQGETGAAKQTGVEEDTKDSHSVATTEAEPSAEVEKPDEVKPQSQTDQVSAEEVLLSEEATSSTADEEGNEGAGADDSSKEAEKSKEDAQVEKTDAPMPRIGAGLTILGSKLFVYGGTTEVGEKQVTFDDLWSIDLNQLDQWTELIPGTWQSLAWKGDDEGEEEDDEDEEEVDEEDEEDDEEDDDEEGDESAKQAEELNIKAQMQRIKKLQAKLGLSDESRTPRPREPLRDFFRRTVEVWVKEVFQTREAEERMSGKELRREAFKLADARFTDLYPVLQELDELEEQQRLSEEMQEMEKQRLKDKLREKAKKRKAHLAKVARKEKRDKEKRKGEEDESDESEDDE